MARHLDRERIIGVAIELADADGLDAVSMRRLGQRLGVDPMSLYHHLGDKNALLAAMADRIVASIPLVTDRDGWADCVRATVAGARDVMRRHPWAPHVVQDVPDPIPSMLIYLDRILTVLVEDGFDLDLCHHAIHVLGSRILGFSQDLFDEPTDARPSADETAARVQAWQATMPMVVRLLTAVSHDGPLGACDDDEEFGIALDIAIEGLERRRLALLAP
jgi:AcrR family transcriptional regulator